nr:uncharacterized protein CI109_005159 [Kwoniella shandongensis]KAA5526582.1 hypothetical protein CI109_005159 [Kwoniella shandongensis]
MPYPTSTTGNSRQGRSSSHSSYQKRQSNDQYLGSKWSKSTQKTPKVFNGDLSLFVEQNIPQNDWQQTYDRVQIEEREGKALWKVHEASNDLDFSNRRYMGLGIQELVGEYTEAGWTYLPSKKYVEFLRDEGKITRLDALEACHALDTAIRSVRDSSQSATTETNTMTGANEELGLYGQQEEWGDWQS